MTITVGQGTVRRYVVTVTVSDADGKRATVPTVIRDTHNSLRDVFSTGLAAAFEQVTSGQATFGHPGEGGCRGPYTVTHVDVSLQEGV